MKNERVGVKRKRKESEGCHCETIDVMGVGLVNVSTLNVDSLIHHSENG